MMYACTYINLKHMASVHISQSRASPLQCALAVQLAVNSVESLHRADSAESTVLPLVGKSTHTKSPVTRNSHHDAKSLF